MFLNNRVLLRVIRALILCVCLTVTVAFGALSYVLFFTCGPTRYAVGFSEAKYKTVHNGMDSAEVESILGPPLDKVVWENGAVLWTYSNRDDDTCDFLRRWIQMRNNKVENVISDYWDD